MSRCRPRRSIVTVIILTVVLLVLHSFTSDNSKRHTSSESISDTPHHDHPKNIKTKGHHSLCILVPFRDRFEELTDFIPKISRFLDNQNIDHKIIVINQVSCMMFEIISVRYKLLNRIYNLVYIIIIIFIFSVGRVSF